ncbi:MAG: 4-coumarate--CoA ligase [Alphaproteobacteria bacterium]|nr:4-coumarate--CoA ligase [Alphaproteobacteria bacterium]
MAWWQDRTALQRYVADLVVGEFSRLRPGLPPLRPETWTEDFSLADDGLGADSLERLNIASALNEALHLHRVGAEDYLLMRWRLGDWLDIATHCLQKFDSEIGFRTSGSSGPPKLCTHAVARLEEETDVLATLIGRRSRVLQVVPGHHIYGFLFTVMLPRKLGDAKVVDGRNRLRLPVQPGDLVIGYPEFWTRQLQSGQSWPEDVIGIVSTGPCPPAVAAGLRRGALHRFIEVYGASETAGIGWRDGTRESYTLFPYWQPDGTGLRHRGSELSVALQDHLLWQDETQFTLQGRHDGAVQVGGINVFPAHVRDVLCRLPGVREASVRPMPLANGVRLKAFVVPTDPQQDTAILRKTIEDELASQLSEAERPRSLTFGAALPVSETGKMADWNISD